MPTLRFGGTSPASARQVTFDGPTLTLAILVAQLDSVQCRACLTGREPCPLFVHDETAFDAHGFLQTALPGDDEALQPYAGVLPQHAESPHLLRVLAESATRCLFPYPCWPLCDTVQMLEDGLSEAAVAFSRAYLSRLRRGYLASDPLTDESQAEDEALVLAAQAEGARARRTVARVSANWLSLLPLSVMLPRVWAPEAGIPVDFALVHAGRVHAVHLTEPPESVTAALATMGWASFRVQAAGGAAPSMTCWPKWA